MTTDSLPDRLIMPAKITTKERLQITRQTMPEQDATARAANFQEVNFGFTEQLALLEADRCLQCKDPRCIKGCPVGVNIPNFSISLTAGKIAEAAQSLLDDNALPAVTGRVCPQETQCETECVRAAKGMPVGIGYLERYVADWARSIATSSRQPNPPPTGRRVAIVGSGPAGLTAAGELARRGHDVTIYEALHKPGGVLVYGIPEFRLPKKIVAQEVERLEEAGVKIECNVVIGRTYTLPELREKFDAMFIANGAGLPVFMNVPGREFQGRLFRQRISHPHQPDGRVSIPARGHAGVARPARGRGRRRQRGHGRRAHRPAARRGIGDDCLSPHPQGSAGPRRRSASRRGGRRRSFNSSPRRWKWSATTNAGSPA